MRERARMRHLRRSERTGLQRPSKRNQIKYHGQEKKRLTLLVQEASEIPGPV